MGSRSWLLGLLVAAAIGVASEARGQAQPDAYQIPQGGVLIANGEGSNPSGFLANDLGDVRGIQLSEGPDVGELSIEPDGTFSYVPPVGFIGQVDFTYQVDEVLGEESLIGKDAAWRYLQPVDGDPELADADFHSTWYNLEFDDSGWLEGTGLIGFGGISGHTIDTPLTRFSFTHYFRKSFKATPGISYQLFAAMVVDDGAIVYLNGEEIARVPESPNFMEPDTFTYLAPNIGSLGEPTVHEVDLGKHQLLPSNTIAISVHNSNIASSDLGLETLVGADVLRRSVALVTITVEDEGIPPRVKDDEFFALENTFFDSTALRSLYSNDGILAEDGSVFDPVTEVVIGGSPDGEVSIDLQSGFLGFDPDPGFTGETSFTYQLRDKDGLSDIATVRIQVRPADLETPPTSPPQPIAVSDNYNTLQGQPLDRSEAAGVLANDTGATNAFVVREVEHGTLSLNDNGGFVYDPNPNFIGTDTFVYRSLPFPFFELVGEDDRWEWLHPLDGIDPEVSDPDFHSTWYSDPFDTSSWSSGHGLMGYGIFNSMVFPDTNIGVPEEEDRYTAYFRRRFYAPPGRYFVMLDIRRDDGAIAYINGEEFRRSPGLGNSAITPDTYLLESLTAASLEGETNIERLTR